MKKYRNFKFLTFAVAASLIVAGCTKLNENLTSSLDSKGAAEFSNLFLANAYVDLQAPENFSNLSNMVEISTDEAIIPIRGGDWADGGEHVAYHLHNWVRQDGTTGNNEGIFTAFNKLSWDATTVLGTNGTADQLAQARFLRAWALYNLLDLWGQFPVRQPTDNLLNPSPVYTGDSAVQFLISELNQCITNLASTNGPGIANVNAARALLMRVYLNRGAFDNRAAPTFAAADMQQVISLGQAIQNSGSYSLDPDYFHIFSPQNSSSPEIIFAIPYSHSDNTSASSYGQPYGSWFMTLHYNSYEPLAPNAGWNGFATMGEFYNTFGVNGTTLTQNVLTDSSMDSRIGGRRTGVTDQSGLTVGILTGQQYDRLGNPEKDRLGNPLSFTNADDINGTSTTINATAPYVETSGFRVLKYAPDFTSNSLGAADSTVSYEQPSNWQVLLRYADVLLMIAEADMRTGDNADALTIVNQIRAARKAVPLNSLILQDPTNFYNPNTLIAERGRELYFELVRRTDLIRFGMFGMAYRLKPADAGNYFVFPITAADLAANPNLQANIQGTNY